RIASSNFGYSKFSSSEVLLLRLNARITRKTGTANVGRYASVLSPFVRYAADYATCSVSAPCTRANAVHLVFAIVLHTSAGQLAAIATGSRRAVSRVCRRNSSRREVSKSGGYR